MPLARRLPTAVLLAVLLASACDSDGDGSSATDPPVVQLGGPGETSRELTDDEIADQTAPGYTDGDVAFVQAMIAHHEQALLMTAMVDERTERDDLPLLAERMDVSQRDEITQLTAWLTERGEDVPAGHVHDAEHAATMPGMLTDEQLAQLEAAQGPAFDELFLQYMIRHHEGAVIMVEQLLTEGAGGQEPAVFQLAQHIDADQRVEIARMKDLLAELAS